MKYKVQKEDTIEQIIQTIKEEIKNYNNNVLEFYKNKLKICKSKKDKKNLRQLCKKVRVPVFYRLINQNIENYKNYLRENFVDFIVTDPPYSKKYLYLYEKLGELAKYVLKDKGLCIVMTGQSYLLDILELLSKNLNYLWTMAYLTPGGQSPFLWKVKCNTFWKPVLIFSKKSKYDGLSFGDVIKTSVNNNDKRYHHWGQSVEGFDLIIERFALPGQLILDPFVGGGASAIATLKNGCSFIGIDVDSNCILKTRNRINEYILQNVDLEVKEYNGL